MGLDKCMMTHISTFIVACKDVTSSELLEFYTLPAGDETLQTDNFLGLMLTFVLAGICWGVAVPSLPQLWHDF